MSITCTHNHQDHTDPETIRRLRHKDTAQFVGPQPSCAVYREQGIETGRIVPAWPDCAIEFRDVTVHGTFALPTDDTDLNHMGYVFPLRQRSGHLRHRRYRLFRTAVRGGETQAGSGDYVHQRRLQ